MSTTTHTATYTRATTHVATNLVLGLKQIITECGLDPSKLIGAWETLEEGLSTWLETKHLRRVTLEIFDAYTDSLVKRFDFEVTYNHDPFGNGELWLDPKVTDYAIRKAGKVPHECVYDILVTTSPGRPDVHGWTSTRLRDSSHLYRRSVGSAIGGCGIGAIANYWR